MKSGIDNKVTEIIDDTFEVTEVTYIPDINDKKLTFGNKGLRLTATVLYIDMRGSTAILNKHNRTSVAKIHKAYFHTIVTIAKSLNGEVRSFNGDGMLVLFQGKTVTRLSDAVSAAMQMKWMLTSPDSKVKRKMEKYTAVDFGIGIHYGDILCSKVGIAGENNRDLVWIGNAINKSVKIGDKHHNDIGISQIVYNNLEDRVKYTTEKDWLGNDVKKDIWQQATIEYNDVQKVYYFTTYHIEVT
ncbi:adenylate/guanylate cyclase domain-containing protein [Pseudoalteromonas sp. EB27]|uniref:adenylate/guanylate cyclase domain-containing protein n=1 Tax=Pseudoalteromonas sp. EB27 TaxID=1938368 RepID=UPI0009775A64|nr:adenylate/guanylate cyclase domain-containing protein [Pseudoalteromonas sp. EB27]